MCIDVNVGGVVVVVEIDFGDVYFDYFFVIVVVVFFVEVVVIWVFVGM